MEKEISNRIDGLVEGFESYAETEMLFGDWAWSMHRETVKCRRQFSSVEEAIESYDFIVRHVGYTLVAWGMDTRGARLVPAAEFYARIKDCGPSIALWDRHSTSDLKQERLAHCLFDTFHNLGLSKTKAQVVTASKAMHHLLPDLVPPIDHEYTSRFFTPPHLGIVCDQNSRPKFVDIAQGLGTIAGSLEAQHGKDYLASLVDKTEYATSESKLIDNAIVGYVMRHELKRYSR